MLMIRHNSYMNTIHTKISQNTTFSKSYLLCTLPLPFHLEHPRVPFISDPSFCTGTATLGKYRITNNSHQHSAVAFSFSLTWAPAKSAWTRKRKSIEPRASVRPSLLAFVSKSQKPDTCFIQNLERFFLPSTPPSHRWIERFFLQKL